jgi:hypothetical protein
MDGVSRCIRAAHTEQQALRFERYLKSGWTRIRQAALRTIRTCMT